jgi:sugar/nucleoside kinase (ribokinase family)
MKRGLLQMSGVVVDLVYSVDRLPDLGGEVEATAAIVTAGGGFNALAAAKRLGARVAYGGALGAGTFADIARDALAAEDIPVLQRRRAAIDQGVCVVLVDSDGERTFVSHHGAERRVDPDELERIRAADFDAVLLSGYSLYHPAAAADMAAWLKGLPRGPRFVFDPGPMVSRTPKEHLAVALERADWVSANQSEAEALTGIADPGQAAQALSASREGALVRIGRSGCWLATPDRGAEHIAGFTVESIDTTGAGDAHVGAFVAALLGGAQPHAAATFANAAAAISTTRRGPARAPGLAEVQAFLIAHGSEISSFARTGTEGHDPARPFAEGFN